MKRRHINESQLRNIIGNMVLEELQRANLNEEMLDEWNPFGWAKNVGRGISAAVGGDVQAAGRGVSNAASAVGGAVKGAAGAVGRGIKNAASAVGGAAKNAYNATTGAVQGAYNTTAGAMQNAYDNVKQGVTTRANAFKANYQAGQNNDKIDKAISSLNDLLQSGVLHGNRTEMLVKQLVGQMGMLKGQNNAGASKATNKIRPQQQQVQQQPEQQPQQ